MTHNSKKIYYSMGEVAEMFDVNASLIRFWESKFDILRPDKNNKGNRLFTPADIDNIKLIYHLVKENGMTLAGAQKRIKENREGIEQNMEIIEKLQRIKNTLLEVKQELKIEDNVVQIFVENSETEGLLDTTIATQISDFEDTANNHNSCITTDAQTNIAQHEAISKPSSTFTEAKTQGEATSELVIEASEPERQTPRIIEQTLF